MTQSDFQTVKVKSGVIMKKHSTHSLKFLTIAGLILLGTRLPLRAAVPTQDLYKEAQLQENTARDPEAAISLYEEFLKQPGTDRALQANAYLHLGLCHSKLGHTDLAKSDWKKIVQDYSDQSDSYAEALNELQKVQTVERVVEVRTSTPVVKVVYAPPVTRWNLDFPRFAFNSTIDGKGRLIDTVAVDGSFGFSYFFRPRLGLDFEIGNVGSQRTSLVTSAASTNYTINREINYVMPMVRAETTFWGPFALYGKTGLGLYNYKFEADTNDPRVGVQKADRWSVGLLSEAGFILGWYRGITLTAGYNLHVFGQATPPQGFFDTLGPDSRSLNPSISQNRGLRFAGGPVIALSFRW